MLPLKPTTDPRTGLSGCICSSSLGSSQCEAGQKLTPVRTDGQTLGLTSPQCPALRPDPASEESQFGFQKPSLGTYYSVMLCVSESFPRAFLGIPSRLIFPQFVRSVYVCTCGNTCTDTTPSNPQTNQKSKTNSGPVLAVFQLCLLSYHYPDS